MQDVPNLHSSHSWSFQTTVFKMKFSHTNIRRNYRYVVSSINKLTGLGKAGEITIAFNLVCQLRR